MTLKKSEEIAFNNAIRESFKYDRLKMLFMRDYVTKNGITIRQPRVGEIVDIGEEDFYRNLHVWVTNPTSYRVSLWHMEPRVDWCKITDFELFCGIFKQVDPDILSIIFPHLNILSFQKTFRQIGEDEYELLLYSEEEDMVIDRMVYLEVSQYLRIMFNIFPKDEFAKGTSTKEAIIWEEEEKLKNSSGGYKSMLFPLISACTNHPGFKYRIDELENVGIYYFMESVNRLQVYENTRALLTGSMSGFCDTSKVPKENFNFMRDLSEDKPKKGSNGKDNSTFESVINNYNGNK